jgi:hypothetical protein
VAGMAIETPYIYNPQINEFLKPETTPENSD